MSTPFKSRQKIASKLQALKSGKPRHLEMVHCFREMAGSLLTELYGFRGLATSIGLRYFDSRGVLFCDLSRALAELIEDSHSLVRRFNALDKERRESIGLDTIQRSAVKVIARERSYMVDMA